MDWDKLLIEYKYIILLIIFKDPVSYFICEMAAPVSDFIRSITSFRLKDIKFSKKDGLEVGSMEIDNNKYALDNFKDEPSPDKDYIEAIDEIGFE